MSSTADQEAYGPRLATETFKKQVHTGYMNFTGTMETRVYKTKQISNQETTFRTAGISCFLALPCQAIPSPDLEEMGAQFPVPSLEPEGVEQSAGLPEELVSSVTLTELTQQKSNTAQS